jgi:hypothetical protein
MINTTINHLQFSRSGAVVQKGLRTNLGPIDLLHHLLPLRLRINAKEEDHPRSVHQKKRQK